MRTRVNLCASGVHALAWYRKRLVLVTPPQQRRVAMSTAFAHPAQAPVVLRHADTPERWAAALKRAQDAGVKVYELGHGRYAVTSAHDPSKAYEVTVIPERCTCPAAQVGDPVCVHRAALRANLHPEPPHAPCDPDAEALRWARNDWDRACRDLERFNGRLERGEVLSDRAWAGFLSAQEREQDASARIMALT